MRVRFIGDPNRDGEGPRALPLFGVTFIKGEWVDVSGNGVAIAKLPGNSHFEVEGVVRAAPQVAAQEPAKRRTRAPAAKPVIADESASDDDFTDLE